MISTYTTCFLSACIMSYAFYETFSTNTHKVTDNNDDSDDNGNDIETAFMLLHHLYMN